ncbi:MAG: HAD family phosphatase [Candidatus Altiarchaeales archaeon]|nr:HAD family phosphatase [Candidatus Altiarchaeales archaeon]
MKAVIFDMDGVLIDSFVNHWKGYDAVMKKRFGFNVGKKEFLKLFGGDPRDITRKLLENHVITGRQDIEGIYDEKKKVYERYCRQGIVVFPGVFETLDGLKGRGAKIALASSSSKETVESMMKATKLGVKFDAVVGLEDVEKGKPNPDLFLKAAERLKVRPEDCWVVEDSLPGVEAGKKAGMKVIGVQTGFRTRVELEKAGADLVVENLENLKLEDLKTTNE